MFRLYQICRQELSCVCVGTCGGWQPLLGSSEAPVSMTITTLPSFVYIKVRATSSAHEWRTGKKKDKTVFLCMPPLLIPVCFFSPLLCLFRSFLSASEEKCGRAKSELSFTALVSVSFMEEAELKCEVQIPCKLVQKAFIFKEREDERREEGS